MLTPDLNPGKVHGPESHPIFQDMETETQEQREMALLGASLPSEDGFPDSQLLQELQRAPTSHLEPLRPPGQPLAGKPIFRGLQASSTPGTTNQRPTASPPHPRASAAGGPSLRLAWGVLGRKAGPGETPGRARRSHALGPGPCLLRPGVGVGVGRAYRQRRWGLGEAGSAQLRGLRQAGGAPAGGRAQGAAGPAVRSFLGIFRHFSSQWIPYHCRPGASLTPTGPPIL